MDNLVSSALMIISLSLPFSLCLSLFLSLSFTGGWLQALHRLLHQLQQFHALSPAAANERKTQPVPGPVSEKSQALPSSVRPAHQTSAEDYEIPPATACKSHGSHVI